MGDFAKFYALMALASAVALGPSVATRRDGVESMALSLVWPLSMYLILKRSSELCESC